MRSSGLGKFFRLPARDRALLLEAVVSVAAVRLALTFMRFQSLLSLLQKAAVRLPARQVEDALAPGRIAWAIDAASRRIPTANSCLPRALAARFILVRRGHPAELSIGVARNSQGKLEAHAWVEAHGKVVVGASEPRYFMPMGARKAAR